MAGLWRWMLPLMVVLATTARLRGESPAAIEEMLRRDVSAVISAAGGAKADRTVGSPGAKASAEYFAAKLQEATGRPVWRQRFLMVVPEVLECAAHDVTPPSSTAAPATTTPAPAAIPLAPLLPAAGQPAALPGKEQTADLVYAGGGTLAELSGKKIAGNFVALDITGEGNAWQTVASLGARGVIFLGPPTAGVQTFLERSTSVPIGLPRFYCDDAPAVARVRSGAVTRLRIRVHVKWVEKEVENLLCLVPGRQTTRDLAQQLKIIDRSAWVNQLVVIQARLDASSQVMGRAPGAEQAASPALAVELARRVAQSPDHCAVLVALTAGDEWQFRGTRMLQELIRPETKDPSKALAELRAAGAGLNVRFEESSRIIANLERVAAGDMAAIDEKTTRRVVRDQIDRAASRVEEQLERVRLGAGEGDRPALERRKAVLVAAAGAVQGYQPLPASAAEIAAGARDALPIWRRERERLAQERGARENWIELRQSIGERLPLVHFEIALTSHGKTFGFFARSSYFWQNDFTGKVADFGAALRRYAADARAAGTLKTFDADSTTGQYPVNTFLPIRRAFSSDAVLLRGQAGGAFATARDVSGILDTPGDTPDRVDFPALAAQAADLAALLTGSAGRPASGALVDPRFYGRTELGSAISDQPLRLLERTLGETTPRLGAAEVLVGGEHELDKDKKPNQGQLQGVRRFDWYLTHPFVGTTDKDVSVTLSSLQRFEFRLHALDFGDDGLPVRAIVQNTNDQRGIVHTVNAAPNRPVRAMLFDCRRLSLFGLFDPRYMEYLDKLELLDARRLDKAQFTNTFVRDGVAAVFMQPELRWQLLVSKGDVTNRMVLINANENRALPEGSGFTTTDLAEIGPLNVRTARDFYTLNSRRKDNLERYGITNQVATDLHAHSKAHLDNAEGARGKLDYRTWLGEADAAWSLQEQVYATLISTSNGIIKGVIFLLLGVIPFSYFLERLLIGATNVYKQIAWFAGIFLVMTAALYGHPAFRISSAPLMILLAFLILILSSTVVYILWGKFEEEIARLRGAALSAHSASLKRGAVFGAALRLGLSNMRRRGMRTTLTLVTLVLLTFTLLCFTSVRETLQLTPRAVTDAPHNSPPGILLRQRAWRAMWGSAPQIARQIAGEGGLTSQRWWFASEQAERRFVVPITAADGQASFTADGLVGIDPAERAFQAVDIEKVLPGFSRLERGEPVCFLPEETTGFAVGQAVHILGQPMVVAGFFSSDNLALRHITGDEFTPTDPSNTSAAPGVTQSTAPEELAAMPEVSYRYLAPRSIAIVPAATARRLGARMTSVMIRPADPAGIEAVAEGLARRSAFTVFVSDGRNVRSLNSVEAMRPQNLDKVLVPLIIAGVIVLNTMLGAVAERTREIHVYTSVGLAPSHVGMLFLAEAAALGTLGVVFGYIFGQVLATILSHTNLITGVDLNYSSMAAIFTMGLVLALVMLSSLWPARAATRVAAPSLQRDWKLPRPTGDLLAVDLPFTVNQVAARGVCAFLEEYLLTAGQSGRFTADHVRAFEGGDEHGHTIRGIACKVWLAPYDLGVIQNLWLAIHPTGDPHVFDVKLTIVRDAGSPATWFRLNRPFLVEIRKQFLLWRAVHPDMVADYVARSEVMFADAEDRLPPLPAPTPAASSL